MSRTFSTSWGSGDTLKGSSRHGLSPKARQISATVVLEIPCLAAKPRLDQCVASGGAVSRVSATTDGFHHVVADRTGSPGPGRVHQPVEPVNRETVPPLADRDRIAAELGGDLRVRAVTRGAGQHDPTAQRQRLGRAVPPGQRCSVERSSALKTISTVGRPRRSARTRYIWRSEHR